MNRLFIFLFLTTIPAAGFAQGFQSKEGCLERLSQAIHNQGVFETRAQEFEAQREFIPAEARGEFDALIEDHRAAASTASDMINRLLVICQAY